MCLKRTSEGRVHPFANNSSVSDHALPSALFPMLGGFVVASSEGRIRQPSCILPAYATDFAVFRCRCAHVREVSGNPAENEADCGQLDVRLRTARSPDTRVRGGAYEVT